MGNCYPYIRKKQKGNREICLAILGIDNAGKTTTTKNIKGESLHMVAPTIGFDKIEFSIDRWNITMYDVGGGKNIRDIWFNYFPEVHGLVYVVDSSDIQRMAEAREVLASVIQHEKIGGKPVLLLANKQDRENALDEGELLAELNVEELVNKMKTPCNLERCSATIGLNNKKMDKSIRKGLRWLLDYIDLNWTGLNERVQLDMMIAADQATKEREARRIRVQKIREERELQELQDGKQKSPDEAENDNEDPNFDPFKPLDLTALEEKSKAAKTAGKEEAEISPSKAEQLQNSNSESSVENLETQPAEGGTLTETTAVLPKSDSPEMPAPLLSQRNLAPIDRHLSPLRLPSLPSTNESGSSQDGATVNGLEPHSGGKALAPLSPIEDCCSEGNSKKKKKKKRHGFRKNKLVPIMSECADDGNDAANLSRTASQSELFVTQQQDAGALDAQEKDCDGQDAKNRSQQLSSGLTTSPDSDDDQVVF